MTSALKAFWISAMEQITEEQAVLSKLKEVKGEREEADEKKRSLSDKKEAGKVTNEATRSQSTTQARIHQFNSKSNSSFYKMC